MDIKAIPDIVLDVSRAASPARQASAVARLEPGRDAATVVRSSEPHIPNWSVVVSRAASELDAPVQSKPASEAAVPQTSVSHVARGESKKTPAMQFEAFVLQTFVEAMLPKEADGVFGGGTSGDIWRSMLAEHMAAEIARGGGLGIATMIDKAKA